MIVLAVDTCLGACSAALAAEGGTIAFRSEPMTRGHQERLAPMVGELMAAAAVAFSQVDRIGVTVGPGSFTGLRVGVAFAKGLALALGRPCAAVGTLEALAASVEGDWPRAAVIDAGRGRLYLQLFAVAGVPSAPRILAIDEAAHRLPPTPLTLIGPGARLLAPFVAGARIESLAAPEIGAVARLALRDDFAPPVPLYLRPADAVAKTR
ncbi:MAG: tRNA (adenosine(37)-N6)-threonylcarbamoyltransferase complex dimerization subunit type 1 TsaB [Caulobacteraceae bacterium]